MSVDKKPFTFGVASAVSGQVLTVDHTQPNDVKWSSLPGESWVQIATGSTTSGSALNLTSLTTYDKYYLTWTGVSDTANTGLPVVVRFNSDSGSNYRVNVYRSNDYLSNTVGLTTDVSNSLWRLDSNQSPPRAVMSLYVYGCRSSAGNKRYSLNFGRSDGSTNWYADGIWLNTSPLTSINASLSSGSFDAGTYFLYGSN